MVLLAVDFSSMQAEHGSVPSELLNRSLERKAKQAIVTPAQTAAETCCPYLNDSIAVADPTLLNMKKYSYQNQIGGITAHTAAAKYIDSGFLVRHAITARTAVIKRKIPAVPAKALTNPRM